MAVWERHPWQIDFARHCGLMRGNRLGECHAQIKITANTLFIPATKAEPGLRVGEIDGVFYFAVLGGTPGTEVH